jgi:nucleotide-binding universal stress UspA family protein
MEPSLKKILVTTDFSDLSKLAFGPAASLARRFKSELHLVHVLESLPASLFLNEEGVQVYSPDRDYRSKFQELLARFAEDPGFGGYPVKPHLLEGGYVHERLVSFQKHHAIDLSMISAQGRTGLGHFFLGSFAERVVRLAQSPVLVYRPPQGAAKAPEEFAPQRIFVPFDFSDNARSALPFVRFFGHAFGSQVRLHYVLEPAFDIALADEGVLPQDYGRLAKEAPEEARKRLLETIEKDLRSFKGADAISELGNPVVEIPRRAAEFQADLIVMATHGRTGLAHMFLGSVTEKVVQKAPCSVLTIRPTSLGA